MSAGIFRQDNPYNTIMGRIGDLAMLSVAWTFFSIPVFTIGASTSAACEVAREIVEDTDEGVFRARRADCAICSRAVSLLRPDSGSTNASSMATITNTVTVTP